MYSIKYFLEKGGTCMSEIVVKNNLLEGCQKLSISKEDSMKNVKLWSWLIKKEIKNEIYCPTPLNVTINEFKEALEKKIVQNNLPAKVSLCEVNWDDTNTKQTRILVTYTGKESMVNIMEYLVGMDNMGNFSYVEEKVIIKPPELPQKSEEPRNKKALPDYPRKFHFSRLLFGFIGGIILGMFADALFYISIFIGIILTFNYRYTQESIDYEEVKNWNRKSDEEEKNKIKTIKNRKRLLKKWQEDNFYTAYLATTNDIFGRFNLAISSTVKQVIKELFTDKNAEIRNTIEQLKTQKELEEELEKRKDEFK